jgi:hypothetical protein
LRQICCPIACARGRSRLEPNPINRCPRFDRRRGGSLARQIRYTTKKSLEIATISASRPNPAKGTPWLVIAQTNIFTPTEAGTFEAVFTLTDPVTGMTKQVTFTIVVAAA